MTNVLGGSLSEEERTTTWNVLLLLKAAMKADKGERGNLYYKEKWHWDDWVKNYTKGT